MDVFTDEPYRGNPLAVVVDAVDLSTEQMQQFANWTNLSETTFLLPPTHPDAGALLDASWLVNGPEWIGVLLESAGQVLGIRPDFAALDDLKVGVIGPSAADAGTDFEVRTFIPGDAAAEDPVTGSFNAGAAQC